MNPEFKWNWENKTGTWRNNYYQQKVLRLSYIWEINIKGCFLKYFWNRGRTFQKTFDLKHQRAKQGHRKVWQKKRWAKGKTLTQDMQKNQDWFYFTQEEVLGRSQWSSGWESSCQCKRHRLDPGSGKIPRATGQLSPRSRLRWDPHAHSAAEPAIPASVRSHAPQSSWARDPSSGETPPRATQQLSPRSRLQWDPHAHRAAEPAILASVRSHAPQSSWARDPGSGEIPRAHGSQPLKPTHSRAHEPQLEKARGQQRRPSTVLHK